MGDNPAAVAIAKMVYLVPTRYTMTSNNSGHNSNESDRLELRSRKLGLGKMFPQHLMDILRFSLKKEGNDLRRRFK